jgi:predicted component of type VI protein secretion system
MDGKDKAEELIGKLLNNPDLMKSLAATPKPESAESR